MKNLTSKQAIADFREGLDIERHITGHTNPSFKMRHFKKLLKKLDQGKSLTKGERSWIEPDIEPLYDMDGTFYHQ